MFIKLQRTYVGPAGNHSPIIMFQCKSFELKELPRGEPVPIKYDAKFAFPYQGHGSIHWVKSGNPADSPLVAPNQFVSEHWLAEPAAEEA